MTGQRDALVAIDDERNRISREHFLRRPIICCCWPWNFKDEIMRQQQEFKHRGGGFIVPIPAPQVAA
jgi:hypothetical protein